MCAMSMWMGSPVARTHCVCASRWHSQFVAIAEWLHRTVWFFFSANCAMKSEWVNCSWHIHTMVAALLSCEPANLIWCTTSIIYVYLYAIKLVWQTWSPSGEECATLALTYHITLSLNYACEYELPSYLVSCYIKYKKTRKKHMRSV